MPTMSISFYITDKEIETYLSNKEEINAKTRVFIKDLIKKEAKDGSRTKV